MHSPTIPTLFLALALSLHATRAAPTPSTPELDCADEEVTFLQPRSRAVLEIRDCCSITKRPSALSKRGLLYSPKSPYQREQVLAELTPQEAEHQTGRDTNEDLASLRIVIVEATVHDYRRQNQQDTISPASAHAPSEHFRGGRWRHSPDMQGDDQWRPHSPPPPPPRHPHFHEGHEYLECLPEEDLNRSDSPLQHSRHPHHPGLSCTERLSRLSTHAWRDLQWRTHSFASTLSRMNEHLVIAGAVAVAVVLLCLLSLEMVASAKRRAAYAMRRALKEAAAAKAEAEREARLDEKLSFEKRVPLEPPRTGEHELETIQEVDEE